MSSPIAGKATMIPARSVTHRSVRTSTRAHRTTDVPSRTVHDVLLVVTFLLAFPLAVNVTAVLADDGVPDRTVPLVDRGAP